MIVVDISVSSFSIGFFIFFNELLFFLPLTLTMSNASSPQGFSTTATGAQDTTAPMAQHDQVQVQVADSTMIGVEGDNGPATVPARRTLIEQATQTLMHWSTQLGRTDLSPQDYEIVVARHAAANRALESLLAGFATMDKAVALFAPVKTVAKKTHGTPLDLPFFQ